MFIRGAMISLPFFPLYPSVLPDSGHHLPRTISIGQRPSKGMHWSIDQVWIASECHEEPGTSQSQDMPSITAVAALHIQ
jgi:hypothetical protein